MGRRVQVIDLFAEALEYGLAVIDGLEDETLEGLEQEEADHGTI
jgi:hypothetical protein